MTRLGVVIPWYGPDVLGGAEQQAFQIARRLARRGHKIEVLTTCSRAFHSDWSQNYYRPGVTNENDVIIRRFPVDPSESQAFHSVNAKILAMSESDLRPGVAPLTTDEAHTFVHENIKSAGLLQHLRVEGERFDAFLFLPYMFSPTMLGLPLVSERAWLQPCLHDEPQAYFVETAALFRDARRLLFNSEGEFELALRLYGPGIHSRSTIIGEGIELDTYPPDELRRALPPELRNKKFVLYLGRRDASKNLELLTRGFADFKSSYSASNLQLVLAGPGKQVFAGKDLHDLGTVAPKKKAALLSHARALVQPSRKESFSRAIMEAWVKGKPVVAHRECLATAGAVERSGGGWLASTEVEWSQILARIESTSEEHLAAVGARGQAYAQKIADWESVIDRYEHLLAADSLHGESTASASRRPVHQLLPDVVYGDAISNHARTIRDHFRSFGYTSEIFARRRDPRMESECALLEERQPAPGDGLIYHHSIASELTAFAVAHHGPKCLIYHNVTPAEFFVPYRPGFAWMLEEGRAGLGSLARSFSLSVGDSEFNAAELERSGFAAPGVLPIIIDPERWNIPPDMEWMNRLQDGRSNILFVGRIAPNKRQDRLVEMFAEYRRIDPIARLILIGEGHLSDPYFNKVRGTIERLQLKPHVEITGLIDDAQLQACYRTAHLYWSASEHEGFGAPLIEAMWFDVPVLALNATAVCETLGSAAVLYEPSEEVSEVASRAYQLAHVESCRRTIIAAQRNRRLDFTPAAVRPILMKILKGLSRDIN